MKTIERLLEGIKVLAIFGAVALVVWSMPEYEGTSGTPSGLSQHAFSHRQAGD